jgi:hypothetical protein
MPGMSTPTQQLEKLRRHRSRPGKDWTIGNIIADMHHESRRTHKRFGELVEIWEHLIPADVAVHTSLSNLRAGILHVSVDSSSAAFELDRLLRSGVESEIRRKFRGTVVRVKTRISAAPRPAKTAARRASKR